MWIFRHKYHDVKNAFLHGHLSKIIYMDQPPGFVDPQRPDYVCHLQCSLYGLKQASHAWFQCFACYATRVGFQQSKTDSSLFMYHRGSHMAYLMLYVDDIILTTSSLAFLQRADGDPISDLTVYRSLVGTLSYNGLLFCYTSKIGVDGDPVSDLTLYRSLAGALQYLTFTRPDISYAVQHLHVSSISQPTTYTDAEWAGFLVTRRSTLGYCVFCGDNLLSWSAKRHVTFSRFSVVAEYRGDANAVAETTWRTKHIEIDIHFVGDFVASRLVRVLHVPSQFQYADIFTKGLPRALFLEFRSSLNVRKPAVQTARVY
ncbi:ribonuclease H-like domain-containing protein [Tanacetum coccineum]